MTIDVPDVFPANFERPSLELLCFIKAFQSLCLEISLLYRDIKGEKLFSAYVRSGWNTVFNTDNPGEWYLLQLHDGTIPGSAYKANDEKIKDAEELEEWQRCIVMEQDRPGDWVVARLSIGSWKYQEKFHPLSVTLRSSDFESHDGKDPKAAIIMQDAVRQLAKIAHTVPRSNC